MDRIGRYQIVRELGRGAMGVVYLATDPTIGRPVAIKTIRLGEVSNPQERAKLRERLFREARSAGALSHPGIVTIYDVEEEGGVAYIAMEYVNGPTLDQLLSDEQPLASDKMFSILRQTSVTLDYAHQRGIIHRDIKPANIMLDQAGQTKITDFGIAKITASEQFTMTGTIVGTPHYMSPEQVQGREVDGRADQFSLAVIVFEMMTGEKPFTGEQLTTVVYRIVADEPAPLGRLNPTLGPQIEAVLRKGLAKKAEGRYVTCQEFVEALEAACNATQGWKNLPRGGSLSLPTVSGESRPTPAILPPLRSRIRGETTETRDRRWAGVLPFLFAILTAAGLVALIAWQAAPWLSSSKTEQAAAPAPAPPPQLPAQYKPSPLGPAREKPAEEAQASATVQPQSPPAEKVGSEAPAPEKPRPAVIPPSGERLHKPVEKPRERPAPPRRPSGIIARNVPSPVSIATNPPGATAILDDQRETRCTTPCTLEATSGRHTLTVSQPGYQPESREILVGNSPQELSLITLRAVGGTLMLSTTPRGATIYLNGRLWPQTTPAQLSLAAGSYEVAVEKDGKRVSERVQIRNAVTSVLKIPLSP